MKLLLVGLVFALLPAAFAAETAPPPDGTEPLAGETVFIPELRGIVCVPEGDNLPPAPAGFAGVDVSRTPLLSDPAAAELMRQFLGKPMSFGSLDRLCIGLRTWLRVMGQPFVSVHAPPQEVTDGVIRLVVRLSHLEGEIGIEGARWFSEDSYRAAVPLAAGAGIDGVALQAGVDRLNRNPHRRVVVVAEPGSQAGTTRLVLRTQESKPWQVTAGYSNSGTAVTDEHRLTAGWSWGNAFGRGDTLGYNLSADPGFDHSVSHSANYGTTFASGRSLVAFGSHSTIESALPAPLTQEGTSWQAGVRFGVPLAKSAGGWERSLSLAADFKYSDNTLEFAAIPITDNVTHIAQFGVTLSATRRGEARSLSLGASLYASPGGLTPHNEDAAFAVARPGAKAAYAYGRLDARLAQRLPGGFSLTLAAGLQAASGPLLGSEQLNGGGSAGVRGFGESTAFGDDGAVVNAELHLPGFAVAVGRDQADAFVFVDAAVLGTQGPGGDTTELASAGVGLNYRLASAFSLRAAYGWALEKPNSFAGKSGHGHVSANFSF